MDAVSPELLGVDGFALILFLESGVWLAGALWDWNRRWYLKMYHIKLTLMVSTCWRWGDSGWAHWVCGEPNSYHIPDCSFISYLVIV